MSIKNELGKANSLLKRLYKKIRAEITDEQWQQFLDEIKQKQLEADGRVLEDVELEKTAEANLMARILAHAQNKDK